MADRGEGRRNARRWRKAGRAMDMFADAQDDATLQAQHEVMKKILRSAKEFAPVDTGALRRSGRVRKLKSGSKVTFGGASTPKRVDYAAFVEYGTMRVPPRYFLKKALKKHQKHFKRDVVRAISKQWNIYAKLGSSRVL
mgnify:CR=1 FL=1